MTATRTAYIAPRHMRTIKTAILHLGFQPGGVVLRPRLEELYTLLANAEGSSGEFEVNLLPEQIRLIERALNSYGENTARRQMAKDALNHLPTAAAQS